MTTHKNLFATILTYPAPSANYRGESENNRTIIQKITKGDHDYPIISPEAMRNALREILIGYGLPMNRSRVHNAGQLAVEFKEIPNAKKYADDFLFGFLVADKKSTKRDSILRMNIAVGLTPYRFNATFHQSPQNTKESPWQNATNSALLHKEVAHTAFQYPFAIALDDCVKEEDGPEWTCALLKAIGELSNVAGGHARSYFEMAPKSIVARLTTSLVAGFNTYGFNENGYFDELARIKQGDLPGKEFWIGGEIARSINEKERERLISEGVHFNENPQALIAELANKAFAK